MIWPFVAARRIASAPGNGGGTAPSPPPSSPDPAPEPGDYSASATIALDSILRPVPRTLFGTNVEWIRDANSLWDPAADRLRSSVLTLARDMGLRGGAIRYPGGVFADFYRWTRGVGPRSTRPVTETHPGSGEAYRILLGTDEFLSFCSEIDAEPLLQVNVQTGTPQEAADWVAYCNSPVRRVTWWEIGNEQYMNSSITGPAMSAIEYASRVNAFAAAMRAVDPNIRIGAVGLRNYGTYLFNDVPGWNQTVLRNCASAIDFFALHNAYAPPGASASPSTTVADAYRAMLAAPVLIAQNLADTRAEIAAAAPGQESRIRLAITEWGPFFDVDPSSRMVDHVKTLASGLFTASALCAFLRDPTTDLACGFKLSEPSFMGWIGTRGGGLVVAPAVPTGPYYGFKLVAHSIRSHIVGATISSPSYASTTVGSIAGVASVPLLDGLASRSADGRSASVIIVNRSLDRGAFVTVSLPGLRTAVASLRLLSGTAPDANTGTSLPQGIGISWGTQASYAPGGRFPNGGDGEISLVESLRGSVGSEFRVRLPPHSAIAVLLDQVER